MNIIITVIVITIMILTIIVIITRYTCTFFPGLLYSPVSVLPNMKLAEFRYGREEMLALFDKNVSQKNVTKLEIFYKMMVQVKYPEELAQFGSLFVEKTQFPLNLMQVKH